MLRLLLALLLVPFGACVHAQDVAGTVFEVVNDKRTPSAGAFVIVHWTGTRPGLAHYESVCIQAAVACTDAQGRYQIAEPPPLRSTFLVWRSAPSVAVYKPGLEQRDRLTLVPTRLDPTMRAAFVDGLQSLGCRDDQGMLVPLTDAQGVLPAFREALAAEAPPKPSTKVQVQIIQRVSPQPAAAPGGQPK